MPLSSAVKLGTKRDEVESTIGGQTSCIVCFKRKSHVPCGHMCVCEDFECDWEGQLAACGG